MESRGATIAGYLDAAARGAAIGGGLVLVALTILTVVSVILREVTGRPIPGDFELVEIGSAVAAFAFLPYCQMVGGNVIVDFVTARAPQRLCTFLDATARLSYTLFAALLTWRLILGGLDMYAYADMTMVLRVPIWWGFVPIVLSTILLTAMCALTTWRKLDGTTA